MSDSPSEDEEDVSSSASVETSETNPVEETVEGQDGNTAESSSAPAAPKTMLDAVKTALAPKEAEESPTSEQGKAEPEKAADSSKEPKDESKDEKFSEDEWKALSGKTKRRIKFFEKKLAGKDQEIGSLKGKAGEYDKIETFVRNSGITNETVGATLQIAALMRHNPREALTRLAPIVTRLQEIVGETLPPELHDRVQKGFLTTDDAKALARSQAEARIAESRRVEQAQRTEAERAQGEQRQLVDSTVGTIETWEAKKATSDPDWNLKRDEIAAEVERQILLANVGRPPNQQWFPNSEEAVKLSQDAYDKVSERYRRFTPKPREIKPAVPGAASNRNSAAPKSMLDVVRQTVGAAA